MESILEQAKLWLAHYGMQVVGAIAILVLGILAAKAFTKIFRKVLRRAKIDETLVSFGGNMLQFVMIMLVVIAALSRLGFQTSSLIAMMGAAALAVGLSLQSNLSNLAAGVLILIFRPFRLGEMVEMGGILGKVEEITIMVTKLRMVDGKLAIMPNTKAFNDKLINFTAAKKRRVDLVIGIGYGDDIKKAKDILQRLVEEDPRVLKEPKPSIIVLNLGDSSVDIGVRPWTKNTDWWAVKCDLTEKIKLTFDAEGINIPYPQRDVHLYPTAGSGNSSQGVSE
ncbi:MAG: mechanosensitive ion channel [Desulfarculus sp.]|nr:mechanosensitive ion channel [Pseudomonadota bacterium]MBV1715932.1 mechanosensitive ion channel [Desulfarculus sp.]MBU4575130.1 mechanosensitive ion channel [Pseudomonadota bacterium]MBU4600285.1 mechanosensitive ion channel [Pseudomonadota bacterium]MBV1738658.1 mechanosensitive ion channel [Desulfarculus sp.]